MGPLSTIRRQMLLPSVRTSSCPGPRALSLICVRSVSGDSLTTTPEHLTALFPTADTESILVRGRFSFSFRHSIFLIRPPGSKSVTTTSENFSGEKIDTAGSVRLPRFALILPLTSVFQDTELGDDEDDGSTTVTNSTANLTDLIIRPTSVSTEVLTAKLECITAALIEEAKSLPEPPVEEPSVTIPSDDSTADLPSHDEPPMDLPSNYEPAAEFGTATQESAAGVSANICAPFEPSSNATDPIADPVCIDERGTTGTSLEDGETQVEAHLPSQDDLEQDIEPWTPDYEVPLIIISPPSEADPEDFAQEFSEDESESIAGPDFEGEPEPKSEHEESEYDDESELEYADDYPDNPVPEVVLGLPPSPVEARDDPCRSPITKTGKLWSDDEGEDLGPLPFGGIAHEEVYDNMESSALETSDAAEITGELEAIDVVKQTEAQFSPVEEETSDAVSATSDDSNGMRPAYPPPRKMT